MAELKKFTLKELAEYNGRNGKPAYIAYKGKVYDVTESDLWSDGDHQGLHEAGRDLTKDMEDAPHDPDELERFPIVGELVEG
ncbi:MAG: cytochrome b5 domain-containing protein [Candidatus Poribacteria bacterium]